jgi:YebC/PmpR family DNA-binding regulatory protein
LLIGQRSTLPADVSQMLLIVGLTHIIAVSGYNLTIMVHAARRLLAKRSKFQTAAACLALITIFMLITGSSPSIVRASIISVLSLCAWYYGRTIRPLTLLLTAGAASVLANPLYIWGNVSWYLSFLAFFGVLVVAPLATRRLYGKRTPGLIEQILIESACAELTTLPYVLFIFGQMSLVNLPANVLVAAWVPLAMLLGVAAGTAGMLAPALAGWIAWPAKLLLTYMLDVAQLLARVPHAFVEGIGFPAAYLAAAYGALAVLLIALRMHSRREICYNNREETRSSELSGHSKWSTIKREKGAKDAARGAVFTKLGNAIAIAARAGTDPTTNFSLRLAIDKAKTSNMPLANIERAIQRVADKNAAQLQELTYEGYGPGGVAILVEVATDNINRTYPEVKLAFSKHGGNIAEKGAVAFQFDRKGMVRVAGKGDELLMQALEAGAEDVQEEGDESVIYTEPADLAKVRDALRDAGLEVKEAELTYVPNTTVEVTDKDTAGKIMRLMDALEDCDEVTNTHVNFDIPENLL